MLSSAPVNLNLMIVALVIIEVEHIVRLLSQIFYNPFQFRGVFSN